MRTYPIHGGRRKFRHSHEGQYAQRTILAVYPNGWKNGIANFLALHQNEMVTRWTMAEVLEDP